MKLYEYEIKNANITGEDMLEVVQKTGQIFDQIKDNIMIHGKIIYFSTKEIQGYSQDYWHIGSLEKKENNNEYYNILPCNNTVYSNKCNNCNTHNFSIMVRNKIRDKCVYRMFTIEWIREITNKVNEKDINIKKWYSKKIYNGQLRQNLKIRYQERDIDYLIILEEAENNFFFVTAYPVFEYREKRELDKEFAKNRT